MSNQINPAASVGKAVFGLITLVVVASLAFGTWFTTDEGFTYVVQNTWTGNVGTINGAGTHIKMPFFTKITEYKQVATVDLSGVVRNGQMIAAPNVGKFTRQQAAAEVAFADTYTGDIPAQFRFRLPSSEDEMLALHK